METDIYINSKNIIKQYCQKLHYGSEIADDEFFCNNPRFYLYYPYLFAEAFNYSNHPKLKKLCIAGFLLYRAAIIKDKLLDEVHDKKLEGKHKQYITIKEICQDEAMHILMSLFDSKSSFWQLLKKRKIELNLVEQLETQLYSNYSIQKYYKLADYKSAFGKLAIDSIFVLSGNRHNDVYKILLNAHKHFSIGFQLLDDSNDIIQDLINKQFNYCVSKIRQEFDTTNYDWMQKVFYAKNYASETYKKSLFHFCNAANLVSCMSKNWSYEITAFQNAIRLKSTTLLAYKQQLKKRIELNNQKTNDYSFHLIGNISEAFFDANFYKGLSYMSSEAEKDFAEAKHIMYLPPNEGFCGRDTTYVGDVFSHAIIWDVLSELNNKFNLNIANNINLGVSTLISKRRRSRTGGWSYLPMAKENATDADDLGQILQLLLNSNNKDLAIKYCSKPINILLTDNQLKNGGIKTWIIPKLNQTKTEKIQLHFNKTKWGSGPNPDVVANFLYGLYLLDKDRYAKQIIRSSKYLAKEQHNDGYWLSRWYYREYYGTYVCIRILFTNKDLFKASLKKAIAYILSTQNSDGGWGANFISNPLDTAFSLLSLSLYGKASVEVVRNAISYLISIQNENGGWDPVNFIKPRYIEPYKSSIITTAFVLKAISNYSEFPL